MKEKTAPPVATRRPVKECNVKSSGDIEIASFLQHLRPVALSLPKPTWAHRHEMRALASGERTHHTKWCDEKYTGTWELPDLIAWLQDMKKKHEDKESLSVGLLYYGDSFGVEWEEHIPVTEEEREDARQWLANSDQEPGTVVWRNLNPLDSDQQ